jgi:hypothetical protein
MMAGGASGRRFRHLGGDLRAQISIELAATALRQACEPVCASQTTVGVPMKEPAWWQRGVIYQVYPRSFQDSDADVRAAGGVTRRKRDHGDLHMHPAST